MDEHKKNNQGASHPVIRTYPDSVLRQISEPVENMDKEIVRLIENMAKSMYINQGVGLAAPQVGVSRRVITFDIGEGLVSLINPQIIESDEDEEIWHEEGCLSLPNVTVDVKRKGAILIRGWDVKKDNEVNIEANDLLARVLQHEIDHLNGVLLIDKTSRLKRQLLINKLKKRKQEGKNSAALSGVLIE